MSAGITPVHYQTFPGSMIGRQIAFFHVRFADLRLNGMLDQEKFRDTVRIIQTACEVMWISVPYVSDNYGAIQVMVSYDTANPYPQNGQDIQTRLQNLFEDGGVVFRREYMVGSNFYNEEDFLNYVDSNQFVRDTNGTPVVFTGVEQDELNVLYANW